MRQGSERRPRFGYRRVGVLVGQSFEITWRRRRLGQSRLENRGPVVARAGPDRRPHRADHPNHAWTYDLLHDQFAGGKRFKTLSVLDEFTCECLATHLGQCIRAPALTRVLAAVMAQRGAPAFVRSDNGSEFTAMAVMAWLREQQVDPTYIAPDRPWQNG